MKRPLLVVLIGLVLGELIGHQLQLTGLLIPASLLWILFIYKDKIPRQKPFFIAWIIIVIMMFAGIIMIRWDDYKLDCMNKYAACNEYTEISGTVLSKKENSSDYGNVRLHHVKFMGETLPKDIILSGNLSVIESLLPGDHVTFEGYLECLERPENPGEFDEMIYQISNGIYLKGSFASIISWERPRVSLRRWAHNMKRKMQKFYEQELKEEDAALFDAMILGDKSRLNEEQKRLYEENGLAHLLAISGLHVSIVGGRIFRFLRKRGRSYTFSAIMSAFFLFFYGCMTGFGTSIVRAYFMFLIFLLSQISGMAYDLPSAMGLSGILMLIEEPYRIFYGGFIISYLAIFAIGIVIPLVVSPKEEKGKNQSILERYMNSVKNALISSGIIFFVTLPACLRLYYGFTPYSIVMNPMVLPFMNLLMISGIFAGIFGNRFGALPALLILRFYHGLLSAFDQLPFSHQITGCLSMMKICALYLLEFLLFALWYWDFWNRRRLRRGILCVCAFLICFCFYSNHSLKITMLDVGQGDSILIQTADKKSILIDGGSTSKQKIYEKVMEPAFSYYGVSTFDYVVVTHMDEDHVSGIREMIESGFSIGCMVMGKTSDVSKGHMEKKKENLIQLAERKGIQIIWMGAGDSISMKNGKITCLHPQKNKGYEERNDESVVLYLQYGAFQGLFTGDVGMDPEEEMIQKIEGPLNILKIAHHGSKYSTSEEFLEAVSVENAIISVGYGNRYGHPHKELLQRLQNEQVNTYQTKKDGAIYVNSDGKGYSVEYWKNKREAFSFLTY